MHKLGRQALKQNKKQKPPILKLKSQLISKSLSIINYQWLKSMRGFV